MFSTEESGARFPESEFGRGRNRGARSMAFVDTWQTTSSRLFNPLGSAAGISNLMPALFAYSGIRISENEPVFKQEVLGRIGSLEIRLASKAKHVRSAQKLRYQVFYDEMSASPNPLTYFSKRDIDPFDAICDHLMVVDLAHPAAGLAKPKIVGTYRLLRQSVAKSRGGFYTEREFDVGKLLSRHETLEFLELGRSCVLPAYRDKRTVELLWHGIWTYVVRHKIDAMIGCASFEGTNPDKLALPLSFLHHHSAAPENWRVQAQASRYVEMNRMRKKSIDAKAAMRALPPLIKGYLRVGAFVGSGAVVDRQFGTTDVFIGLPVTSINQRYLDHFGPGAERHAA
jgi:L-ornithine Nalpha-acyltransferase